jgi:hypothetical protein
LPLAAIVPWQVVVASFTWNGPLIEWVDKVTSSGFLLSSVTAIGLLRVPIGTLPKFRLVRDTVNLPKAPTPSRWTIGAGFEPLLLIVRVAFRVPAVLG